MSKPPVNVAVPLPPQKQQQHQPQQKPNPQNPDSAEWTDEKLVDALKRLDDLHTKLINLRTVIPRLTLPLSTNHPSPAELYDDLSTRARGASEEVLAFNSLFVESHTVFDHANASREQNPEGIQSVSVYEMFYADEEGTAVEEVKQAEEDTEMKDGEEGDDEEEEEEEEEVIEDTKEEDVDGVIAEFKRVIEDVVVDIQVGDSGRAVKITLPSPADLLFTIDIPSFSSSTATTDTLDPSSAARRFIVTSIANVKKPEQPTPHLYTSILRSITTRPNAGNLQLLLEMLAEYKSIYSVPCKKCGRMTAGTKVELPVVRSRDTVLVELEDVAAKKKSKKKDKVWNAYHEVCV